MRPITDVLRDIRRGRVVDAATLELASVVRDVIATGKKGEVTIKLKIDPVPNENMVTVQAAVTAKSPRADLPNGMFFADKDGGLLREDPEKIHRFAEVPPAADDGEEMDPLTGELTPRRRADA